MPIGGTLVVTTACLHTFHYECAKVWLTQHDGTCPDCRTRVRVEDFSFPQEVEGDAEIAVQLSHNEQRPRSDEDDDVVVVGTDDTPHVTVSNLPPVNRTLDEHFAATV